MPLNVFISHTHQEKELAESWKDLISKVSQGAITAWLSSDKRPGGGMDIGSEWREHLYEKLQESQFVLAILSPQSLNRPWIIWECGVASSFDKKIGIIPVIYSMEMKDFNGPLSSYQAYPGEDRERVIEILERLIREAGGTPYRDLWEGVVDAHISSIKLYKPSVTPAGLEKTQTSKTADHRQAELWQGRIEMLMQAGRKNEIDGLSRSMYASLGKDTLVDIRVHDVLSSVFLEQSKLAKALAEVEKALKLSVNDLNLLHRKALILMEKEDYGAAEKVIAEIDRVWQDDIVPPEIAGLKGRFYRERYKKNGEDADLNKAIHFYKMGFENDPMDYYCGVNALSLLRQKAAAEEANHFSRLLLDRCVKVEKTGTSSFWLDFTLGELYLNQWDVESALKAYQKGLTRAPAPQKRERKSALEGVKRVFKSLQLDKEHLTKFEKVLK